MCDSTPTSLYRTPSEEFFEDAIDSRRQSEITGMYGQQNHERKISIQVKQLEMGMVQRTYDMKVSLK